MGHLDEQEGYAWSGDLAETGIREVYGRCTNLRLSGQLLLADGPRTARITFIGGDVVETDGGDTREILLWEAGSFHVAQRMPDLAGQLTDAWELAGELLDVRPKDLIRHCEDSRLTADLELERPSGEQALVCFTYGHVECTEINGRPELAALGRISEWVDGRYKISLRALFGDDAPPVPPPLLRGEPPPGQLFDFTTPHVLEYSPEDVTVENPTDGSQPIEPPGMAKLEPRAPLIEREADPAPPPPKEEPAAAPRDRSLAATAPTLQAEAPRDAGASPPAPEMSSEQTPVDELLAASMPAWRSRWLLVMLPLVVIAGAAVIFVPRTGLLHRARPPALREPVAVDASTPVALAAPSEEKSPNPPPPAEAPMPRPTLPPEEEAEPAPAVPPTTASKTRKRSGPDYLVDKGRRLLVEGHPRTAFDTFKMARRLDPNREGLDQLEAMALGKTGRATLVIQGSGRLMVDGHLFRAPQKLKVPAGPHLIGPLANATELVLRKGQELRIPAEKR